MTMRPRKNPLPLTLDNVVGTLKPGRPYTIEAIALTFGSSPAAALGVVDTAIASGSMMSSREVHGFRRTFWVPIEQPDQTHVATRRWQPGDMKGEWLGYDLRSLQNLCMTIRRGQ